jgi:hypothetical protein
MIRWKQLDRTEDLTLSAGLGGTGLDLITGSTTSSKFHLGEAVNEGVYLASTVDNQMLLSSGAEYLNGSWYSRATQANILAFSAGGIGFYGNTSLNDGNTFTPKLRHYLTSDGKTILGGESSSTVVDSGGLVVLTGVAGGGGIELALSGGYDSGLTWVGFAREETYGSFRCNNTSNGGLFLAGFGKAQYGLSLNGYCLTEWTDDTTSVGGCAYVTANKKLTANTFQALSDNANIFAIRNSSTCRIVFKGNGDVRPTTTDAQDLGSSSKRWDNVYAKTVIADTVTPTTITTDSWTAPTLTNSWSNYASFAAAGYKKTADGTVHIKGLVRNGTVSATSTGNIFTLPTGYRPSELRMFTVVSSTGTGRLDVNTDGSVRAVTGSNTYFSLEISFQL